MTPAELGDDGIDQRLRYHAYVERSTTVWIGSRVVEDARLLGGDLGMETPVLDATRERLEIAITDDGFRYAVWIPRSDAALAPTTMVQLADADGRAHATSGAWVNAGARIAQPGRGDAGPVEGGDEARAAWRATSVLDEDLDVHGYLPASALGPVWPVTARPPPIATTAQLAASVAIRVAPRDDAAIVATTKAVVGVRATGQGAWREVELQRPWGRIHGYAPASALGSNGDVETIGTAGGHGFGISDTDIVHLVPGACLFEAPGGDVTGVALDDREHYAFAPRAPDRGAWLIFIGSPWNTTLTMWANDLANDPNHPRWEICGSRRR